MRIDEDVLRAAKLGYEQQLQIINGKIDVIRQELRGRTDKPEAVVGIPAAASRPKRQMSAAGRERIRQAQIARWKKQKKASAAA